MTNPTDPTREALIELANRWLAHAKLLRNPNRQRTREKRPDEIIEACAYELHETLSSPAPDAERELCEWAFNRGVNSVDKFGECNETAEEAYEVWLTTKRPEGER